MRVKQNPLPSLLRGKSVAIVDDSIVRGTTSRKIIELILEAGAREVHLRIAAPPTISPCYYGIDTPRKEDLIAARMTQPEIAKFLGVSSLRYLTMKEIYDGLGVKKKMCDACFTEKYPVPPKDPVLSKSKVNLLEHKNCQNFALGGINKGKIAFVQGSRKTQDAKPCVGFVFFLIRARIV